MDDTVNRLAREMADAIAALVAADPRIEACRERARAAGYEMHVSLEAVVGFAARHAAGARGPRDRAKRGGPRLGMNANDRRFLRSLRIAPDDPVEVDQEQS
ncbi:MAG: hypothetical protein H6Q08_2415 [Acidobacteria bacterium]|jgi:hypothetical protein|nr:hypothetical protein [Acidobacteriota bacterium]